MAHKVGPAIAAGCPFVLKPSEKTPVSSALLASVLCEANLPPGSWSMVPNTPEALNVFVSHPAIKCISFTGSARVGWHIYQNPGKRKVLLELGGDAACIVDPTANLEAAADRIVFGAFANAGQVRGERERDHLRSHSHLRSLASLCSASTRTAPLRRGCWV